MIIPGPLFQTQAQKSKKNPPRKNYSYISGNGTFLPPKTFLYS